MRNDPRLSDHQVVAEMTDNKEGKEVYDHIPHTLGGKTTKDQREVCPGCGYADGLISRDINMVHDDAILGAVAERDARIQQKHGVMARKLRDAFNKGSSLGREARDREVLELKAKIAGLEGRIQGMMESRDLGK